ncbi:MAG: allantoinase AllB [Eubacteriales bacterium]|nr:allantoinase AllB [Clostridiales bacterium]MDY5837014.1 allantoinase AllB [Eubacteriales bacterium]
MYDLLIQNGLVVSSEGVERLDLAVKDGRISALGIPGSLANAREIVDAKGRYVFPGAIDTHAHLNDPGYNWRETFDRGTAAAAVGGYTTIFDMPLQNVPAMTNVDIMHKKLGHVQSKAFVDYCLWGGLVDYNFDSLLGLYNEGVVAFKSFIGPVSSDYVSLNYGQVREALEVISSFGGIAGFHCEDFSMIKWGEVRAKRKKKPTWQDFLESRPVSAELIATEAVITLAEEIGCRVHICHVSHPDVAKVIASAQEAGVSVTAETCTHYLAMTEEDVIDKGSLFKCAPPLRSKQAKELLWEYVLNGTFAGIASDHSPCALPEKCEEEHGVFGTWGGISGIQSSMQVIFSEGVIKRGFNPSFMARTMSENPARAFGIWGKKGALKPGFDADIVILDPVQKWEITSDSLLYINKISAFVGMEGTGYPVQTYVRGKLVAANGGVVEDACGYGEFVKRVKP